MFGEIPALWGWIGGAVIFGAVYYIVQREARLGRAEMKARHGRAEWETRG